MRILIVLPNLATGGAEIFALRLAKELSAKNETYVYDLAYPLTGIDISLKNRELLEGVQLIKFSPPFINFFNRLWVKSSLISKLLYVIFLFFRGKQLEKIVTEKKIEIVNTHLIAADTLVSHFLKKVVHIITLHGSYEGINHKHIRRRIKTLSKANGIIYTADKNLIFMDKFSSEIKNSAPIVKIYNGMKLTKLSDKNYRTEWKIPEDAFVFIMVARPTETKGWREAIRAFELLVCKNAYFVLVGDGPYIEELKTEVKSKNIIFHGYGSNPIDFLLYANVGLLPTFYPPESLPNSVSEYLTCGLPVISTNMGDIRKMIAYEEKQAGFIIPFDSSGRASVTDLNNAMNIYLQDAELYQSHKKLSLLAAQKFEMSNCVNNYLSFYGSVLKKNVGR